ncbi:MAG: efflux RND transporter periplasmic adaptor subunit [Kiritimatiellae bacterium]|nr:efflux RND transporter periplasmic adaptor subunit [Kiritimatiellia bacterium]
MENNTAQSKRHVRRIVVGLIVLGLLALLGWRIAGVIGRKAGRTGAQMEAVPVTVAPVTCATVPEELRAFGNAEASATVSIRSQITGVITVVNIQEGQDVKPGDLLFTIDSRPLAAALKEAEANLVKNKAQYENAEKGRVRQEELLKKGFASEDDFDKAKSEADALAATVHASEAEVENARVQLEYCSICAPIGGRAGEILIHKGNLVKANDLPLITINQLQPIEVAFGVPQQFLLKIKERMGKAKLAVRAHVPNTETNEIGVLNFVDNAVDRTTGMIQLKARFTNETAQFWPGQFLDVTVVLGVKTNALTIPSRAVQDGQKGPFVYVVKPDLTVEARNVTVERTFGESSIVEQGLTAAELVAVDGQLRLKPGAKVEIKGR